MPIEHIKKTDTLNDGREKINEAIDGANDAKVLSTNADVKATEALAKSETTQTQLDTIVIDGDSSVEAAQARLDERGITHQTLKERIDGGFIRIEQSLEDKSSELTNLVGLKLDKEPFLQFELEVREKLDDVVEKDEFYKVSGTIGDTSSLGNNFRSFSENIYDHGFNVKDFGAQGNGIIDDSDSIQAALDAVHEKGKGKVLVPAGNYKLTKPLIIYENTSFIADKNAILLRSADYGPVMANAKIGEDNFYGYEGRGNIEIIGGVWEGNDQYTSTFNHFSIGHAENILFDGLVILNNQGAHHIEINGIKGCVIRNCHFEGHHADVGQDFKEAIQIDLMKGEGNFPSFGFYDNTTCKDVLIENNLFKDVIRGVGGHVAAVGHYHDNIIVRGNTFEYIRDRAVRPASWLNSIIEGNAFSNVATGVEINNELSIAMTDIIVKGNTFSNIISEKTEMGRAINVIGAAGQEVLRIIISDNTIINTSGTAVHALYSRDGIITQNTIRNPGRHGIQLSSRSESYVVKGNNISGATSMGINIADRCYYNVLSGNIIAQSSSSGIGLSTDASYNRISGNFVHSSNQGASGVSNITLVGNSDYNAVSENSLYRGVEQNKPLYGVSITSSCTGNFVSNNFLRHAGSSGGISDSGQGTVTNAGNQS